METKNLFYWQLFSRDHHNIFLSFQLLATVILVVNTAWNPKAHYRIHKTLSHRFPHQNPHFSSSRYVWYIPQLISFLLSFSILQANNYLIIYEYNYESFANALIDYEVFHEFMDISLLYLWRG